jgi:hypothetical protein
MEKGLLKREAQIPQTLKDAVYLVQKLCDR